MKLSVIVPVYNVEKFLPRCLDSLLRQGMKSGEWEVICVNDGSPDNCAAILAEYSHKHPDTFKVITQKNMGVGEARNKGVKVAQGVYVGFVDPDDYVIDNGFSYLLEHFYADREGNEKVDVIHYNYRDICTDGKTIFDPEAKPDGLITFDGDGAEAYNQYPMICVWTKLYRRSFLLNYNIWSKNVIISQDELFNFDVFCHHPHLLMVNSCIYRYENGYEDSTQKTTKKERVFAQLEGLLYDMRYINKYLEEGRTSVAPAARRTIAILRSTFYRKITSFFLSSKEWHCFYKELEEIPLYQIESSNGNRITRWLIAAKQKSLTSYPFYVFFTFIRNVIFVKFIRPYILKMNTTKDEYHC